MHRRRQQNATVSLLALGLGLALFAAPVLADSPHLALDAAGLRGYADYMRSPAFEQAVQAIVAMAQDTNVAIMCAEKTPLFCHRSLIADWLRVRDIEVRHIGIGAEDQGHDLRPEARIDGQAIIYDRGSQGRLI